MELRQYLIDTFNYNLWANTKLIEKINELPDKTEGIKFISHLINCQKRWLARINQHPDVMKIDWWFPLYELNELEAQWTESVNEWIAFLKTKNEEQLCADLQYTGLDGGRWQSTIKDIALQLNYHSIHHRAQLQTIIRQQGLTPDFLDYIGTVYKKLS